jgi:hypothetical protein
MPPTDLVVVLPGILGSALHRDGEAVWPAGTGLTAARAFLDRAAELTLPAGVGDEHPGDGVVPGEVLTGGHALPGVWTPGRGCGQLMDRLRRLGYQLLPVGYDWRLSARYTATRLKSVVDAALDRQPGARLVLVAHGSGGLVARWYLEHCGGAAHTRALVTFGTPVRGAAVALAQLVNGAPVPGAVGERLTAFLRSLPSMHQLLPGYPCVEVGRRLRGLGEVTVPELDAAAVADGLRLHAEIGSSTAAVRAIVGTRQPTPTTVRVEAGRVLPLDTYGDGTVPVIGAIGAGLSLDTRTIRRVSDRHGNLPRNLVALDELQELLTGAPVIVRSAPAVEIRVSAPEFLLAGDPLTVITEAPNGLNYPLRIRLTGPGGTEEVHRPRPSRGVARTTFADLAPGAYGLEVTGISDHSPVAPVAADVLVWPR